jgi:hypothetical protein
MTGKDFLTCEPVPFKFSNISLLHGASVKDYEEISLDTGDIFHTRV